MELLWHNGPVVMHNQNQRSSAYSSLKKSLLPSKLPEDAVNPAGPSETHPTSGPPATTATATATQLFMQEDDMTSWLHYNLDSPSSFSFHRDLCADLLYPTTPTVRPPDQPRPSSPPPHPPPPPPALRPPIPPARRAELHSFGPLLRAVGKGREESTWPPSDSRKRNRESTVVDSSETPPPGLESRASTTAEEASPAKTASAGGGKGDTATAEPTVTSSPGGSGSGGEPTQNTTAPASTTATTAMNSSKSRTRESDEEECHSEVSPHASKSFATTRFFPSVHVALSGTSRDLHRRYLCLFLRRVRQICYYLIVFASTCFVFYRFLICFG